MASHRVLIIGTGSIGERHLRCMGLTGRATVGMVEVNEKLRNEVAQRYGVKDVFAAVGDALASKWDAAVVCTPAHTHIPVALQLADAGVHLFIEKPLSTTTEGVVQLIEKTRSRGIKAGVAYPYRSHPGLAQMRQAIIEGRFGRPLQLVVVSGQNFPFFRPAYRNIYYTDRTKGGGAIQDALTHLLNAGEWLVGPIDRLSADAAHLALEGVSVEDTAHIITRQGTVMGCYTINQFQCPNEGTITVNCERGTARFELHEGRWRWMTDINGPWHDEPWPKMERDDWFTRQANLFLDALEGRAPVLCTLEEGLQTLKVNLAALASADSGFAPQTIR